MVTTAGRKARRAEASAKVSADPAHKAGAHKDTAGAVHEKGGSSTSQEHASASPHNKGSKRKDKRGKRAGRGGGGGGRGRGGADGGGGGGRGGRSAQGSSDSIAGDDLLAMPVKKGELQVRSISYAAD